MEEQGGFTRIHVSLPNHWASRGETLWARKVGRDLYEVRNIPFYAYGLHFGDRVVANTEDPSRPPEITAVEQRSGHRTLRVMFKDFAPEAVRDAMLRSLERFDAYFEQATPRYYALDVEPEGNYDAVCEELRKWEQDGLVAYETCQQRVPGSFDDEPPSPE
ncbi:MAG: DUF4265 domain-containing protein [Desulfatibacillaceae bacterium]